MPNQSGTVTSSMGAVVLGSSPNDTITFTPSSGTYTVEYPLGTVAINASSSAQTLTLTGGQLRITCVSGSVAYALIDAADAYVLSQAQTAAAQYLVSDDGNGRTATAGIVLDEFARYVPVVVAGATALTVSGAARISQSVMVIADGVNIPTISGADEWADSFGYLNTPGVANRLDVWYDGYGRRYSWSQQMTPSAASGEVTLTLAGLTGLTNASGTYTGGAGVVGWAAYGRSGTGLSIASGADGWVSVERAIGTLENVVIAWHNSDAATDATACVACMQINRTGAGTNPDTVLAGVAVAAGSAATIVGAAIAVAAGVRYRIGRAGSVWTIQSSTNAGVSWATVYTFPGVTSTARVYPLLHTTANNAIRSVKQFGLA